MRNEDMCSSEIMCNTPYRNKIMGHLFTKEEELQVKIKRLENRIDKLERDIISSSLRRLIEQETSDMLWANQFYRIGAIHGTGWDNGVINAWPRGLNW